MRWQLIEQASQHCQYPDTSNLRLYKMTLRRPFNSREAMQRAKRNVESHYAVVGTWEDTNTTLSVLETYIPRFFAGARQEYYAMQAHMDSVNRNAFRPTIGEEARALLSRNMTHEIEFYRFVRQRLHTQYIAVQSEQDRLQISRIKIPEN